MSRVAERDPDLHVGEDFRTAVIMMAGKGTRGMPSSLIVPPGLAEIGRTNAFELLVSGLSKVGVEHAVVVVRHDSVGHEEDGSDGPHYTELLTKRFLSGDSEAQAALRKKSAVDPRVIAAAGPHDHGMTFDFVAQDPARYGTAASLAAALPVLRERGARGVLVANSDAVSVGPRLFKGDTHVNSGWEFAAMTHAMAERSAQHGISVTRTPHLTAGAYTVGVPVMNKEGEVQRVMECPDASLLPQPHHSRNGKPYQPSNVGNYALGAAVFDLVEEMVAQPLEQLGTPEYWITHPLFEEAARRGQRTVGQLSVSTFIDCATPAMRHACAATLARRGIISL